MCRSVTAQRLVNPKKYVLRQVFRFGSIPGKPVADIENAPRVLTYKLLPGGAISLEALLDQLGILLQRKISLESTRASLGATPLKIYQLAWSVKTLAGPGKQWQIRRREPIKQPLV